MKSHLYNETKIYCIAACELLKKAFNHGVMESDNPIKTKSSFVKPGSRK